MHVHAGANTSRPKLSARGDKNNPDLGLWMWTALSVCVCGVWCGGFLFPDGLLQHCCFHDGEEAEMDGKSVSQPASKQPHRQRLATDSGRVAVELEQRQGQDIIRPK